MSDLQCPATFLVLAGDPADDVAQALMSERVAAVYAGSEGLAGTAGRLAGPLGLTCAVEAALGGSSYPGAIEALADVHRGETVVLVPGAPATEELRDRAGMTDGEPGYGVVLAVDGDGWSVRPWTGT